MNLYNLMHIYHLNTHSLKPSIHNIVCKRQTLYHIGAFSRILLFNYIADAQNAFQYTFIYNFRIYVHGRKIENVLFHTSKSLANNVRAKQCMRGIVSPEIEVENLSIKE